MFRFLIYCYCFKLSITRVYYNTSDFKILIWPSVILKFLSQEIHVKNPTRTNKKTELTFTSTFSLLSGHVRFVQSFIKPFLH